MRAGPGPAAACLALLRLLSSEDEPLVEAVDEADEQVVDMSTGLSTTFLAGVDLVESDVVGLKTPTTAAPRDEICWW